jgi:hypothetical protein
VWTAADIVEMLDHAAASGVAPFASLAFCSGAEVAVLMSRAPARPIGRHSPWVWARRLVRAGQVARREGLAGLVRRVRWTG